MEAVKNSVLLKVVGNTNCKLCRSEGCRLNHVGWIPDISFCQTGENEKNSEKLMMTVVAEGKETHCAGFRLR